MSLFHHPSSYSALPSEESLDCISDLWGDWQSCVPQCYCLPSLEGAYDSLSIAWSSDNGCLQGTAHLLRSPVAEQVIYLVLVLISLISHEIVNHGNNDNLLGWKCNQQSETKCQAPATTVPEAAILVASCCTCRWDENQSHHSVRYFPPDGRGFGWAL